MDSWQDLDEPWQEAFRQAWEALRTGNIPVGACAATADGRIVYAARNRVNDADGPRGEIFGSALAHAEANVLARLPYHRPEDLILTTTLQPCLQCAAVIRLGPIAEVRFAGADRYWDGCHDFARLSPREAARPQVTRTGPRRDELGTFAVLISRLGPGLSTPAFEANLRTLGEGPLIDLARDLDAQKLAAMEVGEAFAYLRPRLTDLHQQPTPSHWPHPRP